MDTLAATSSRESTSRPSSSAPSGYSPPGGVRRSTSCCAAGVPRGQRRGRGRRRPRRGRARRARRARRGCGRTAAASVASDRRGRDDPGRTAPRRSSPARPGQASSPGRPGSARLRSARPASAARSCVSPPQRCAPGHDATRTFGSSQPWTTSTTRLVATTTSAVTWDDALQHRHVAAERALDRERADAGQVEDLLDDRADRQQPRDLEAGHRHDGHQRVLQRVLADHRPRQEAGGAHVVLPEGPDHADARLPRDLRGAGDAERDRGQRDVPQPAGGVLRERDVPGRGQPGAAQRQGRSPGPGRARSSAPPGPAR